MDIPNRLTFTELANNHSGPVIIELWFEILLTGWIGALGMSSRTLKVE